MLPICLKVGGATWFHFLPGVRSSPLPPLTCLEGSQCSADGLSQDVMEKAWVLELDRCVYEFQHAT